MGVGGGVKSSPNPNFLPMTREEAMQFASDVDPLRVGDKHAWFLTSRYIINRMEMLLRMASSERKSIKKDKKDIKKAVPRPENNDGELQANRCRTALRATLQALHRRNV